MNGYANIETENDIDRQFFQKITKKILSGLKAMVKFNPSRCEIIALSEAIPLFVSLASTEMYNKILIPIFSDMISSSKFVRDCLKSVNALQLILTFLCNKSYKVFFADMIKNLLTWLQHDKSYVSVFLLEQSHFVSVFKNILTSLSRDTNDYLSIILKFFDVSEEVEKKFFSDDMMVVNTWKNIIDKDLSRYNDCLLLLKIVDFFEKICKYKDRDFLINIDFFNVLENTRKITNQNKLIIVEEKLKKIYTKLGINYSLNTNIK